MSTTTAFFLLVFVVVGLVSLCLLHGLLCYRILKRGKK